MRKARLTAGFGISVSLSEVGITEDRIDNDGMTQRHMYELLQKKLVEARQSKGLTQTEIAARLGKPQSFVSKYESGERRLDVVEFLEVCQALSIEHNSILNKIDIDNA